jgi:hypothetical protein
VGDAYRDTEALSFHLVLKATILHLGISKFTVGTMFKPLAKDKTGFPNPNGKSLVFLSRDIHLKQLWPGENQTILVKRLMEYFDVHLTSSRISKERPYTTAHGQDVVVPLMTLTSDMMIAAGQDAYFGPTLAGLAPNLGADFLEFDELSWQLLLQYPPMFCQKMLKAKTKVEIALRKYIEVPMNQRKGDIWFKKAMEAELKALNMPTNEIGIIFMTVYWVCCFLSSSPRVSLLSGLFRLIIFICIEYSQLVVSTPTLAVHSSGFWHTVFSRQDLLMSFGRN